MLGSRLRAVPGALSLPLDGPTKAKQPGCPTFCAPDDGAAGALGLLDKPDAARPGDSAHELCGGAAGCKAAASVSVDTSMVSSTASRVCTTTARPVRWAMAS